MKIQAIPGVEIVTEVIEDYAYFRYRDADVIATMKGVSDNFIDQHRLDDHIVDGTLKLKDSLGSYALMGRGIQYALSVSVKESISPLQVFYIKNAKSAQIDPSKMYSLRSIQPGAIFSIEKNIDENYVVLPLEFVKDLMNYGDKRTSLEIKILPNSNIKTIPKLPIQKKLGNDFSVLTNEEQHKRYFQTTQN